MTTSCAAYFKSLVPYLWNQRNNKVFVISDSLITYGIISALILPTVLQLICKSSCTYNILYTYVVLKEASYQIPSVLFSNLLLTLYYEMSLIQYKIMIYKSCSKTYLINYKHRHIPHHWCLLYILHSTTYKGETENTKGIFKLKSRRKTDNIMAKI